MCVSSHTAHFLPLREQTTCMHVSMEGAAPSGRQIEGVEHQLALTAQPFMDMRVQIYSASCTSELC
jgi:hypothetical protein